MRESWGFVAFVVLILFSACSVFGDLRYDFVILTILVFWV